MIVLFKVCYFGEILVAIVEIFTCHAPNESIVVGGGCRVYAPTWREDCLFVVHPDVTCLVDGTHKVANGIFFGDFEVEVGFHTTVVDVRRHCVPNATWAQFGHTHL